MNFQDRNTGTKIWVTSCHAGGTHRIFQMDFQFSFSAKKGTRNREITNKIPSAILMILRDRFLGRTMWRAVQVGHGTSARADARKRTKLLRLRQPLWGNNKPHMTRRHKKVEAIRWIITHYYTIMRKCWHKQRIWTNNEETIERIEVGFKSHTIRFQRGLDSRRRSADASGGNIGYQTIGILFIRGHSGCLCKGNGRQGNWRYKHG